MNLKYYCLSLQKYRRGRFLVIKKESFVKHNIPIIEFEGIDGIKFKSSKEISEKYNLKLGSKLNKSSPILISIAQSHRNVWKKIMADKSIEYNIIFEDDIIIKSNNFKDNIYDLLNHFKKLPSPKILLLGYLNVKRNPNEKIITKTDNFSGLQCYMIDKATAKYLYENTFNLEDQIDVMISNYLLLDKYYLKDKIVTQKSIASIAHHQRCIFLEKHDIYILSHKIGINFNLNILSTYHINLTTNTLLNILLSIVLRFYFYIFRYQSIIIYFILLFFEIFIYGGVIFIKNFNGINNNSKYDDDEVVNKYLDYLFFSLILL